MTPSPVGWHVDSPVPAEVVDGMWIHDDDATREQVVVAIQAEAPSPAERRREAQAG